MAADFYKRPQNKTKYGPETPRRLRRRLPGKPARTFLKRRLKARRSTSGAVKGAENKLKNFRQASLVAVAVTGFFLLLFSPEETALGQTDSTSQFDTAAQITGPADTVGMASDTTAISTQEATDEALGALQGLWDGFFYNIPKILIALGTLLLAWLLVWGLKKLLHKTIGRWNSSSAIISLVSIAVWLLAIGVALSVVAGDIRALVGSLGLIGLALSWSLQTPIESFTGWLLNSFKAYYRVGDRIRVGEVFGDVYRIDFLTTTVWEIGSPYQVGYVNAEQPTGRMVTFPNNEILTGTVTNLTGDFPYVWDELAVAVANESDLRLCKEVLEKTALELLGDYMVEPARRYGVLMKKARLLDKISDKPEVYLSLEDSWTNLIVRYLVGARERRKWKSELIFRLGQELAKPEYLNKIIPVYPRQQVQLIDPDGIPVSVGAIGRNQNEGQGQD